MAARIRTARSAWLQKKQKIGESLKHPLTPLRPKGGATSSLHETAERRAGEYPCYSSAYATFLQHQGQMQEAAATLNGLIGEHPDHIGLRLRLAELYLKQDQANKVQEVLQSGIQEIARDAPLRLALNDILVQEDKIEQAEDVLQEALEAENLQKKEGLRLRRRLVRIHLEQNQIDKAEAETEYSNFRKKMCP